VKTFHAAPAAAPVPAANRAARSREVSDWHRPAQSRRAETFSDEEILASVKPENTGTGIWQPKPAPFYAKVAMGDSKKRVKADRATPADPDPPAPQRRRRMGVVPIDVVNSIAGETGLPGKVVGKVDIRERHSFVDVSTEHANAILASSTAPRSKATR